MGAPSRALTPENNVDAAVILLESVMALTPLGIMPVVGQLSRETL